MESDSSSAVFRIKAASGGSRWIATLGGLSRWKEHALTNDSSGPGGIDSILEDSKGRIWFGELIATDPTKLSAKPGRQRSEWRRCSQRS